MKLYDEFFLIVRSLHEAQVPYAVVGGIALSFHSEPRYTKDIDLLLVSDEVDRVKKILHELGFTVEAEPWTFSATDITLHRVSKFEGEEFLSVDLLGSRDPNHAAIIENAITLDTDFGLVRIATATDLIALKRLRNSAQDQADIERLEDDSN